MRHHRRAPLGRARRGAREGFGRSVQRRRATAAFLARPMAERGDTRARCPSSVDTRVGIKSALSAVARRGTRRAAAECGEFARRAGVARATPGADAGTNGSTSTPRRSGCAAKARLRAARVAASASRSRAGAVVTWRGSHRAARVAERAGLSPRWSGSGAGGLSAARAAARVEAALER